MRKKIVAGNWKMNKSLAGGIELASSVNRLINDKVLTGMTVILAPPFIHLFEISRIINQQRIKTCAQNCSSESNGAYTGEVSAEMIRSAGASYVIIGHSERRAYFKETDQELLKKVRQAFENELTPIFCIGEKSEERQSGIHFEVVKNQLENTIFDLSPDQFKNMIIAYEPVWAIGTGVNATPGQAQEIHAFIRELISKKYGEKISDRIPLLYGGSCKASNAKSLFSNPDVDGGLIGGASLDADEFVRIIESF